MSYLSGTGRRRSPAACARLAQWPPSWSSTTRPATRSRYTGLPPLQARALVQRAVNGGPAAARNTGLALCRTPYVAFVDSDCVPEPSWLAGLMPHFGDPGVAAVAPRIAGLDRPGWLGRYEQVRSSLDLGDRAGPVVRGPE